FFGIIIDTINPFGITMNFGVFAIPFTFLWIAVIINAINLIDGLDGLAAGVSVIALSSIAFIGILQNNIFVMMISVILIGSTLGVLYYNFNPAKLFLGDNGSMLLGYVLGVLSILGFKNVTFFSILFPIIILGVPFIVITFIGILQNNIFVMMISVILIGSTLGVLYYNFNPAKLFLGDNGSMLLGYVLGVLSILGFKNVTFFSILFPIIILGVPFIDITFAAVRRYREGVSLTRADRGHLHHKLQYLGFTHRQSVILLYFMA